jgi:putative intracellular protease/amidase
MARVAFLIDMATSGESIQQLEEQIRGAGHEVVVVRAHPGPGVDVDEVVYAAEFDGVLIPGGFNANHFRTHERFLSFLRDLYALGKPLAAVHEGCWTLVPAGTARVTWPAVKRALLVEPCRRPFADDFGVQPLISGTPRQLGVLVDAFLAQLGDRPGAGGSEVAAASATESA